MSNKNYYIFIEFRDLEVIFSVYDSNQENIYFKSEVFNFSKNNLIKSLSKIIKDNVHNIEKLINEFVNDVNIVLNLNKSINIKLNVFKKKENSEITNEDVKYLIQDARQQIIKYNSNLSILHILIDKYYVDKIETQKILDKFKALNFSINLNFICYPSKDIIEFKNLFSGTQIQINKFICYEHLKSMLSKDSHDKKKIYSVAIKTIMGQNENEVEIVPKIHKKYGFFEKLFKFLLK